MTLRISMAQMPAFEGAHFKSHRREVAERAQRRFPSLFGGHDLAEVEQLSQACHDGSKTIGGVQDYDRLVEFMAVNALARPINEDPVRRAYFSSIVRSECWTGDQKVRRLFLDRAEPELPPEERGQSMASRAIYRSSG